MPGQVDSTWQMEPVDQDIRIEPSVEEMQVRQAARAKRRQILQEQLKQLVSADPRGQQSQVAAAATKPVLRPAVRQKLQPLLSNIQVEKPQPQPQESAVAPAAPAQAAEPVPQSNATNSLSPSSLAIAAPTSAGQGNYSNQSGYGVVTPLPPLPQMQIPGTQMGLRLIYPLQQVAPITSKFGWRVHPISGRSKFHAGVDLGGPCGSFTAIDPLGQLRYAQQRIQQQATMLLFRVRLAHNIFWLSKSLKLRYDKR